MDRAPRPYGWEAGRVTAATAERIREADTYLASRTGCYEYRCHRYDAALETMHGLGLDDDCTVVDVGAGMGEFGVRMHTGRRALTGVAARNTHHRDPSGISASRARYVPVDAAIDGVDLEKWVPPRKADFFVCLEVLEHLTCPSRLMVEMVFHATKGVIVSTPNPDTTDVLGMDSTHRTPIRRKALELAGFKVTTASFYGQPEDSLFAVWAPR